MIKDTVKCSLITSFLGQTTDRFHTYNAPQDLEDKFSMVSRMQGVDGVEVVFPYEISETERLKEALSKNALNIAAINVNVKAEPEFRDGGLTSPDAAVRGKAVQFIRDAKDFAEKAGADKVTCCPLSDGYEFHFQYDYGKKWKYLIEGFREAGSYKPEIPLYVEYKPSETRGHCYVDTAAKALCLLNDIGLESLGVTLDFGHSNYGAENPAEAVSMLHNSRFPYYIHINDNDGKWDWDYMVGTRNLLAYTEFLFYLQEFGYDDYLTSDTSPTRWDMVETFEMNARVTNKIWKKLKNMDRERFISLIAAEDYIKTWKFIETEILSL